MIRVPCSMCGSDEITAKCIICEQDLCNSCVITCQQRGTGACDQKAGTIVVYQCPGTFCPKHAKEQMIFTCKDCGVQFCRTAIDIWAKACPTCKDYICGNCYETHIKSCTDVFDKEAALNKLYHMIEGDKK
ncbi:MAG: hypothetical protein ACTSRS_08550 [Candidatus Helarchaeota archaeon]